MAARVEGEVETLEKQVRRAVQLAWLRDLSATEEQAFVRYAGEHGMAAFCRILLNSNEFLFVE